MFFFADEQVQSRISVFQRLGKINEPKQKNVRVRNQKKWKLKKKKQQPRSFVWVRGQNNVSQIKQVEQVNVVSMADEKNAQNFEFSCQEVPEHHRINMLNCKGCEEAQVHANSPKKLDGDLVDIKQGSSEDFVEAIQPAPPEMEDGSQPTIDELREINLGTIDEPKPIFVSPMLNDEQVAQYEQFLQEYKDVFAWGYQDMPGMDPNVIVHKLAVFEGVKLIKQPQWCFCPELTIQINTEVDKLIKANFICEVQYPSWLANIVHVQKKNG